MTRDDIIRMTRQMGGFYDRHPACINDHFVFPTEESLERCAALVAAAERSACAQVCDEIANKPSNVVLGVAINCADAIRAMEEK